MSGTHETDKSDNRSYRAPSDKTGNDKTDNTILVSAARYPSSTGPRSRNVKRFRGGLVVKAHRLVYHATLGVRVIKKKKRDPAAAEVSIRGAGRDWTGFI